MNGKPESVSVKTGITDGIFTEVLEGMSENDTVITGSVSASPEPAQTQGTNPFRGDGRRF